MSKVRNFKGYNEYRANQDKCCDSKNKCYQNNTCNPRDKCCQNNKCNVGNNCNNNNKYDCNSNNHSSNNCNQSCNHNRNIEEDVRNSFDKYSKLSESQLLNEFYREIERQKCMGTLDINMIENFYQMMSPNLTYEQQCKMKSLIDEIKYR